MAGFGRVSSCVPAPLLLDKLREAVRLDPVGVSVVDITKLGIVECTRRKIAAPLHEQISIRKTLV